VLAHEFFIRYAHSTLTSFSTHGPCSEVATAVGIIWGQSFRRRYSVSLVRHGSLLCTVFCMCGSARLGDASGRSDLDKICRYDRGPNSAGTTTTNKRRQRYTWSMIRMQLVAIALWLSVWWSWFLGRLILIDIYRKLSPYVTFCRSQDLTVIKRVILVVSCNYMLSAPYSPYQYSTKDKYMYRLLSQWWNSIKGKSLDA
jgi:hypothetical protein